MQFITVTTDDSRRLRLNVDAIVSWEPYDGPEGATNLAIRGQKYHQIVRETPEEIDTLVREASDASQYGLASAIGAHLPG